VDAERCPVLDPALEPSLAQLRTLLAGSRGHGEAHTALGRERRPVLELRWRGELSPNVFATAPKSVERGDWAGMCLWPEGASTPIRVGDPQPQMVAADDLPLVMPSGGFGQASQEAARTLASRAAALVGRVPGRLVELFAGSGTLSVMLAGLGESFVAVEQHEGAAACLRQNLAQRGAKANVRVVDAAAYRIPSPTHTVVLDPPRGGAKEVSDGIVATRPKRVLYVSCNPATLARDLATLEQGGYRLTKLELFELFPQTSHVELMAMLER
jgi:23S rRNA (uracil1939-C5)-methyltransferase